MATNVSYRLSKRAVSVDLDAESASGQGSDQVIGIEWVTGTDFGDVLRAGKTKDKEKYEGAAPTSCASCAPCVRRAATTPRLVAVSTSSGGDGDDVIGGYAPDKGRDIIRQSGAGRHRGGPGRDDPFGGGGGGRDYLLGEDGRDKAYGGKGVDHCDAEVMHSCEKPYS